MSDHAPACPRCKTDLLVECRNHPNGADWHCHGCEHGFDDGDVPVGLRRRLA